LRRKPRGHGGISPLHQQAFDERACVIRDEGVFEAVDQLTAAVVAVMVLFAVMHVAIFIILEGLAPRAHISDDHGVLLTSTAWIRVRGSTGAQPRQAGLTWSALPTFQHNMAHTLRGVGSGPTETCCHMWELGLVSRFAFQRMREPDLPDIEAITSKTIRSPTLSFCCSASLSCCSCDGDTRNSHWPAFTS
jgi:hypothetical protein